MYILINFFNNLQIKYVQIKKKKKNPLKKKNLILTHEYFTIILFEA